MVHTMLADRPEQRLDETTMPAAADHQQLSSC
jgi:hypothetical protein